MTPEDLILAGGALAVGGSLASAIGRRAMFGIRTQKKTDIGGVTFAGRFIAWDELCRHTLFLGGTGMGKTYASNLLIGGCIQSGAPMMFTTCKPDDRARIVGIAQEKGHAGRVVIIGPSTDARMNLVGSLLKPHNSPAMAAQLLMKVGEVGKRATQSGGDNKFFEKSAERCIAHSITLIQKHKGDVRLRDMRDLIASSPPNAGARANDPQWDAKVADDQVKRGLCAKVIVEGIRNGLESDEEWFDAASYFTHELPNGGDKMRGNIIAEAENTLGALSQGPWNRALSGETTLTPEQVDRNRLIAIVDAPEMVDLMPGRQFSFAWTMETQRYCSRRPYKQGDKPMIIVREEVGRTLNPDWDASMILVSRSQGMAMVDLVQDKESLVAGLGGHQAEQEAWSFVQNHGNVYIFATKSNETNEWASKLIGQKKQVMASGGGQQQKASVTDDALGVRGNVRWSHQWQPILRPEHIAQLPVGVAVRLGVGGWDFVDFRGMK